MIFTLQKPDFLHPFVEILVGNLLKFQRKKTISLNEFIENSFIFGEFNPEDKKIISDGDRCIF